jgi:starvation-inducible DNA-binding protein
MEELVIALKKALATTFAFYLKTHNYHWNVTGPDFHQYHKLLEGIYEEVYDSVDQFGEEIRALGDYAPASFIRFSELSEVEDETKIPLALAMIERLNADNQVVLSVIERAYELAEREHKHGLSNFLAERQDAHSKHAWMLSATLKK